MRYRRITYRYTEVLTKRGHGLGDDPWQLLTHPPIGRAQWSPPWDLYETGNTYVVTVELAGVDEQDLDITVHPDAVVIEGVRACAACGEVRYHAARIWYGPFRLDVPFPAPIDPEHVTGRFERGFLLLTARKQNASAP